MVNWDSAGLSIKTDMDFLQGSFKLLMQSLAGLPNNEHLKRTRQRFLTQLSDDYREVIRVSSDSRGGDVHPTFQWAMCSTVLDML